MAKDKLSKLIENSGYKVSYVANEMGLSVSGFWKLRQDPAKKMNAEQMVKLAKILGEPVDTVFNAIKNF